jgi:S-adenosyl-L-methionine hydrolase (adenosine-forming)
VAAGILTLTTDFGADGTYVAAIKGVVLSRAPGTQIIDVSHSIAPQNIAEGSFVLAEVAEYFPQGTVHLAVVDPGVGTDRRLIVVRVRDHWFVVPDNGLISGILRRDSHHSGIWEIRYVDPLPSGISWTFHGRDLLAPAAAHLLLGGDPLDLGPALDKVVRLEEIEPKPDGDALLGGEVIFVDRFGNLITNLLGASLDPAAPADWSVELLGRSIDGLNSTYAERPPGTLVALIGSSGRLEVAVVNGNAAESLQAGPGTSVMLRRSRRKAP